MAYSCDGACRKNMLDSVPDMVLELVELRDLDLTDNHLFNLWEDFSSLVNLERLYLGGNKLETFPLTIWYVIEQLSLVYAKRCDVDVGTINSWAVSSLPHLLILELRENMILKLSADIGKLVTLTRLDLSQNRFFELPVELAKLVNLTTLDLHGNVLVTPPPNVVQEGLPAIMTYLKELENGISFKLKRKK